MKTVSPLKPTSLFLVLNLAPKGGEQGPKLRGCAPRPPGRLRLPRLWRQALPALGGSPTPVAHQKEKGIFIFGGSGGGCGYVGEVG